MNIDSLNRPVICHKTIHNGKCNPYTCSFSRGHNLSDYIDIDDNNVSRIPCRFLLKESGCMIDKPKDMLCHNWRTGNEETVINYKYEHCRYNHFYKPEYVCHNYLYNTSLKEGQKRKECPPDCNLLHISWQNFCKNMFNSNVDTDKKRSIDFLISMIFKMVAMDGGLSIFALMNSIHQKYLSDMEILYRQYNSKCYICGLKPFQPKLKNPKPISIWVLRRFLSMDVVGYICDYLYGIHNINRMGEFDCSFLVKSKVYRDTIYIHQLKDERCLNLNNIGIRTRDGEIKNIGNFSFDDMEPYRKDLLLKEIIRTE